MTMKKVKLDDVELEIEKIRSKIYVSQNVTVVEADDSKHVESWLVAEGSCDVH